MLNTLQAEGDGDLRRQYRRRDGASAGAAKCLFRQCARDVVRQADVRHADAGNVRRSWQSTALTAGHPISDRRSSTLRNQLDDLTPQLATGKKSDDLCRPRPGSRLRDRPALAGRKHRRFADTANNVNTRLNVANLALQGMADIGQSASRAAAGSSTHLLDNTGQTAGQITAQAAFSNAVSLLNSQSGDRYLFSGRATDTRGDGAGRRHARWQRRAGRPEADDRRAPAGRSGRRQHRTSGGLVAAADDDRDQRRRRRLAVRHQARRRSRRR